MTDVAPVPPVGLARRGSVALVAKVGTILFQTLQFAMLARALDRPTFASLAAGTALLTILGALAEFGLLNVTVMALADGDDEPGVLRAALQASARLVVIALGLAVVLTALLLRGDARLAVLVLVPWFVLSRIDVGFLAVHQFHLRTGRLALGDLLSRGVLVLAAVPVLVAGDSWSPARSLLVVGAGFFASEAVSLAVVAAGVSWRHPAPAGATGALLRRAVPIGLTNASSLVHARSDQVLLDTLGRRTGLAAYAIAFRVNEAILALANAVGTVSFSVLARTRGEERRRASRRFTALACGAATVTALGSFVAAPVVLAVVGGEEYRGSAVLARLLVPALAVSVANLPVAQLVIVAGEVRTLLQLSVTSVVVNIVLTIAFVAAWDARGAAIATSVTESLGFLAVAVVAHRALPGSVPWPVVALVPIVATAVPWAALHLWDHGARPLAAALVAAGLVAVGVAVGQALRTGGPVPASADAAVGS